jgi:hypothetical protein
VPNIHQTGLMPVDLAGDLAQRGHLHLACGKGPAGAH